MRSMLRRHVNSWSCRHIQYLEERYGMLKVGYNCLPEATYQACPNCQAETGFQVKTILEYGDRRFQLVKCSCGCQFWFEAQCDGG